RASSHAPQRPRERTWSQTDAGVTSPRPRPRATESAHTGRPALVRSRRSDPTARTRVRRRPRETGPIPPPPAPAPRGAAGPPAAVRTGSAATVTPLASALAVHLWHGARTLRRGEPPAPRAHLWWCATNPEGATPPHGTGLDAAASAA